MNNEYEVLLTGFHSLRSWVMDDGSTACEVWGTSLLVCEHSTGKSTRVPERVAGREGERLGVLGNHMPQTLISNKSIMPELKLQPFFGSDTVLGKERVPK